MAVHLTSHRGGFPAGWTDITRLDDAEDNTGIALAVLRLARGERHQERTPAESAWLLMEGEVRISLAEREVKLGRGNLFDDPPSAIHLPADATIEIEALGDVELTVYRTANTRPFDAKVYLPGEVRDEARGKGLVDDASLRIVRTIFDDSNSDPNTELVLGEVVHLPGRWSSYPPHHHPQPELYHYRFTHAQGYGHAELGETVLKVQQYDTVKIVGGNDHAQVAAPGYGMCYTWVIRHLPEARYQVPEFTEAHRWTMEPGAEVWRPRLDDVG